MFLLRGFLLLFCASAAHGAASLGAHGANSNQVSVSGLSAGAYMTVQMFVAHSKTFMGAGVVAGGPYYCAQASTIKAVTDCMETGDINVGYLQQVTRNTVLTGTIDATSNMYNQRVYLFSGKTDTVVVQPVMEALDLYLQDFVNPSNIKKEFSINAGHAFITDNFGNTCSANADPFISDCDSNEAYNILNHIYGGLTKPSSLLPPALTGSFYEFNQNEFINFPNSYSMDDTGYAYVPSACSGSSSNCKVHVVLHGCLQGKEAVDTECAMNTGYNEVAALNDIIVIYPQAIVRSVIGNPNGCWDWWGYTGVNYASKLGDQVKAIKGMVDRVLS